MTHSLSNRRFKDNLKKCDREHNSTNYIYARTPCDMSKTTTKTKSQPREDQTDDEDGSLKPTPRPTIAKMIPKQQPNLQISKISPTNVSDSEDEDGGIRPKRKQEPKQKSRPKKSKKDDATKKKASVIMDDSMDEDGTLLKPEKKVKETKAMKKSLFLQCFHQPESNDHSDSTQKKSVTQDDFNSVDEDGGPILKTYDTVKKLILLKQPTLKTSPTTDVSTSNNTTQPSTGVKSVDNQNTVLKRTTDGPSIKSDQSVTTKICFLRTKSYQDAQDSSPPIVLQKPNGFIPSHNRDNHHARRTTDLVRLAVEHLVSLIGYVNPSDEQKRKKLVQNRWYLAYSLIRNPCLSKYRKQYLERDRHNQDKQQSVTSTNKNPSEALGTTRSK